MADPNVDWVPVSALLEAASEELEVGQLLHTSVFSLFEAMSAVEIGNPKMDAGARPKGDTTPLEQREMQLELTQEQLLGVMDNLLCLEATWHNGGALARTVYSSIYMMQPDRTAAHPVLSAYCRAVEAMCVEVNHTIMIGCVCEEEDFNAHIAGLPLEHAITAAGAAASGMAQPAPQSHSGKSSSSSSSSSSGAAAAASDKLFAAISHAVDSQDLVLKQHQGGQAGRPDNQAAAAAAAAAEAVVARLQFRKLLVQGLIKLKRRQQPDLDQAGKLFVRAQDQLALVRTSLSLATGHGLGWDENMNSHLVPAVPPRAVQVYTPDKAVDYFESLIQQLLRVCAVTHIHSYRGLKEYLLAFTAQPICPLSRSALHIQVSYNAWLPPLPQQQQQQAPAAAAAAAGGGGGSSSSSPGTGTYDEKHHQHHIPPPAHHTATGSAAGPAASSSSSSNQPAQQQGAAGSPPAANGAAAAAAAAQPSNLPPVSVPVWCLSPAMLRAALLLSPDEGLGDDGELFMEQAVIATGNMVQALLMNRSRCRRRLRRGLEDWGNLYQHGLNADTSPAFGAYMAAHGWHWVNDQPGDPAGPLATWVEVETCCVMVHHLLMGFELALYEPADYAMIYWYIDLLCMVWQQGSRQLHEQRPTHTSLPQPSHSPTKHKLSSGSSSSSSSSSSAAGNGLVGGRLPNKAGHGRNAANKPGSSSSSSRATGGKVAGDASSSSSSSSSSRTGAALMSNGAFMFDSLVLEAWRHLSIGTLRVMMTLQMMGMYTPPELPFNSEGQRFDQRFASFHQLARPDPLGYEAYVASTSTAGVSAEQLLALAYDSFRKGQQSLSLIRAQAGAWCVTQQQLADLAPLERVAATNVVAVSLLSRAAASSSSSSKAGAGAAAGGGQGEAAAAAAAAAAPQPQFKPCWEFGHNKWFPTLTLKSAAAAAAAVEAGK